MPEIFSPVVKRAQSTDIHGIQTLLEPLKESYLDFKSWLNKTLTDSNTVINVGFICKNQVDGLAIWKPKDKSTVKLSLFYLAPESRQGGLGQHLLFYCLREWVEARFEKVLVTISAQNADLLSFFTRYGFRLEGVSQRRYQRSNGGQSTELVLTKHLFYRRVTEDNLRSFADEVASTVFSLPDNGHLKQEENWFIPPANSQVQATWKNYTGEQKLSFYVEPDKELMRFTIPDLEELFYPLRFALADREAYLVPIQPQWADRMMQINRYQRRHPINLTDKLFLRTDNVYYCFPWYPDKDINGVPILFYVSQPDSKIAGMARILERHIAAPESLFEQFGELGIYTLARIKEHVKTNGANAGSAMAMRFGWWVPFPQPIPLNSFSQFDLSGHPQHMQSIRYDQYEQIMAAGGLQW